MSFKQFMEDAANATSLKVPNLHKSLGKRRHGMPQITQANVKNFLSWAEKEHGLTYKTATKKASSLVPSQKEFNFEKTLGMLAAGKHRTGKIMVSSDGYVIDGHHRWLASAYDNDKIEAMVFNKTFEEVVDIMSKYPRLIKRSLSEHDRHFIRIR